MLNELELTVVQKLKMLPKMFSTWTSLLGAILIGAPINWATLDYTAITKNQVIAAVMWVVVQLAMRMKGQASMSTIPTPANSVTTLIRPPESPNMPKVTQHADDPTQPTSAP